MLRRAGRQCCRIGRLTSLLVDVAGSARMYGDGNFYWIEMMGRLRPGVSMAQAQAVLAPRFNQWVATTAKTDGERANLPARREMRQSYSSAPSLETTARSLSKYSTLQAR